MEQPAAVVIAMCILFTIDVVLGIALALVVQRQDRMDRIAASQAARIAALEAKASPAPRSQRGAAVH